MGRAKNSASMAASNTSAWPRRCRERDDHSRPRGATFQWRCPTAPDGGNQVRSPRRRGAGAGTGAILSVHDDSSCDRCGTRLRGEEACPRCLHGGDIVGRCGLCDSASRCAAACPGVVPRGPREARPAFEAQGTGSWRPANLYRALRSFEALANRARAGGSRMGGCLRSADRWQAARADPRRAGARPAQLHALRTEPDHRLRLRADGAARHDRRPERGAARRLGHQGRHRRSACRDGALDICHPVAVPQCVRAGRCCAAPAMPWAR